MKLALEENSQPLQAGNSIRGNANQMRPSLSIIIVGYLGADMIVPCLRSIAIHCPESTEVLLVNNASPDNTVDVARRAYPGLRVVEMGRNAGYGTAANAGVQAARASLCILMNQDLELETSLDPMLNRLQADPGLGLLGCSLRFPDGRLQLGIGREHSPWRMVTSWIVPLGTPILGPFVARVESRPELYADRQDDLPWASGAFLAFRRSAWISIGGMDEDFFLYVEDVDLARRTRKAGLRVGYEPSVCVSHREASGKSWPGPRALAWTFDGYLCYARKHGGLSAALATRYGLVVASSWRALLHSLLCLGPGRALHVEKARAFLGQAWRLAWSSRPVAR